MRGIPFKERLAGFLGGLTALSEQWGIEVDGCEGETFLQNEDTPTRRDPERKTRGLSYTCDEDGGVLARGNDYSGSRMQALPLSGYKEQSEVLAKALERYGSNQIDIHDRPESHQALSDLIAAAEGMVLSVPGRRG